MRGADVADLFPEEQLEDVHGAEQLDRANERVAELDSLAAGPGRL